jgi:DNA polymerase I-like protein with 3'-5' exonuclease and polymerase domains
MDREIFETQPKAILALGNVPLRAFTGMSGRKRGIGMLRGFVLEGTRYPGIPVIGTYHPSFLKRGGKDRDASSGAKTEGGAGKGGMHLLGVMMRDLALAVHVARYGAPEVEMPVYSEHPGLDEARSFLHRVKDNRNLTLTYDIETSDSTDLDEEDLETAGGQIVQIQFSLEPGTGIAFPWQPEYVEIVKEIFKLENDKANHNAWKFDNPRLRATGVEFRGIIHDTMEMWRRMQPDLPAHLQFVSSMYGFPFPWKHLDSSQPAYYGCCDVDAVQRIFAKLPSDMQKRGCWRSYERHVLMLDPILVKMSNRGIPVNEEKRQAFKQELTVQSEAIGTEIQQIVPDEIKNIHPKEGYKKDPKDAVEGSETTHQNEPARWVRRTFTVVDKELNETQVERWAKLLRFKDSSQQIIRYMKHRKHSVPVDRKTSRETTERKELEKLAKKTRDPLYMKLIEQREIDKMLSTYVEGWRPAADGRAHPKFGHSTGTGQLNSKGPNAQNVPSAKYGSTRKMGLAASFRRMIQAGPGRKLVELDLKSAHALTTGFEAKDELYMRMARIDMHSFFTAAGLLKLEKPEKLIAMSDGELKDYFKFHKKSPKVYIHPDGTFKWIRDKKAKSTILGYGFGMGHVTLYYQNEDSFRNISDAKKTIEILNGLFPKAAKWRNVIREQAHRQTYLLSRHGYIRWFFDVYHYDGSRGIMVPGDDSEAAIAFLPANDAHGHLKDVILRLEARGLLEKYRWINTIHDALLFEPEEGLVEECVHVVKEELEKPSEILVDPEMAPGGLWIEAEASVGKNWFEMEEISVPTVRKAA